MVETRLTCQYCGEQFETKSDLQEHEMNCLGTGQTQNRQQQSGRPQPTSGSQQPSTGRQQTAGKQQPVNKQQPANKQQPISKQQPTGDRTRTAGSGGSWNEEEEEPGF
jgi:hypothetical protein